MANLDCHGAWRAIKRWISLAAVGLAVAGCSAPAAAVRSDPGDEVRRSRLGAFMRGQVNPAFSKLSFLLFHAEAGDEPGDAAGLQGASDELARATRSLGEWSEPPVESEQAEQVFREYAGALRKESARLQAAIAANRRADAKRLFQVVQQRCDSCHHFFRRQDDAGGGSAIARSR
jgi:cytochrome c556